MLTGLQACGLCFESLYSLNEAVIGSSTARGSVVEVPWTESVS